MIKILISQNRISILVGILLTIVIIFIFNSQNNNFSNRFQLITGVTLAMLFGFSMLPKMKGILIPIIALIILTFNSLFF
ncbi:hypothetical protein AB4Y90_00540 [Chryseobacterium sp. 2TAF14]|uniref:hypothetical protein n=1 Tax=Chryseobacterium sp. 2TAF14 TaxID=3233007 RepID=UPI003F91109B